MKSRTAEYSGVGYFFNKDRPTMPGLRLVGRIHSGEAYPRTEEVRGLRRSLAIAGIAALAVVGAQAWQALEPPPLDPHAIVEQCHARAQEVARMYHVTNPMDIYGMVIKCEAANGIL